MPDQVAPESSSPDAARSIRQSSLAALGLSALGIVFGDIGTSPLYTLKTVLALSGSTPAPDAVLGVLSLILWTLIIIPSIKYVMFAMSIDNDGEGGILALMSRLGIKKHYRPVIIAVGLFGAALIYGGGAADIAMALRSSLYPTGAELVPFRRGCASHSYEDFGSVQGWLNNNPWQNYSVPLSAAFGPELGEASNYL